MRNIVVAAAAVAMVVTASPAAADPTPAPDPYQIQTPAGPVYGGMRSCHRSAASSRGPAQGLGSGHGNLGLPAGNLNARKHI